MAGPKICQPGDPKEHGMLIGAPIDYWASLILSFLILIPTQDFSWWIENISLFGLQTLLVILFTLFVLKIDKWAKESHR